MNLIELFETQSKLDARIVEEKGLQERDLLPEKVLALLTELGELANEWRGFKFWSNDQESRNHLEKYETMDGHNFYAAHRNPLLEEYVDNLHFILSLGLELHPKVAHMEWAKDYEGYVDNPSHLIRTASTTDVFTALYKRVVVFMDSQELTDYAKLFYLFFTLGRKLDFTLDQIETAYYLKNEINHERQNTNY